MPAIVEPRSQLNYGWELGEDLWNAGTDANWLRLGRFAVHLSVLDRDLTDPPVTPAVGDTYIPASPATSDWLGKEGQVAVWAGEAWAYGVPRVGWVAYIEDEEKLSVYKAAGWSAGVAL